MRLDRRLVVITLFAAAGCSSFRQVFPRHEDVFTPIPLSLGEPRVSGADTMYTLAGSGYELVARTRDPLPDAKTALEGAAAGYRRYFGEDPTPVVVTLRDRPMRGERSERGDSAQRPDTTPLLPADGRPAVTVFVAPVPAPGDPARGRAMIGGRASWITAAPVVRAWLGARAARLAPAGADTARPRDVTGPGGDPRIPDWLEVALVDRIAGSPRGDFLAGRLAVQAAEKPEIPIPLRTLFSSPRPVGERARMDRGAPDDGDPATAPADARGGEWRPGRQGVRGELLAGAMLFDAQAASVIDFLVSRESMPFVGSMADVLIAGGPMEEALRGATRVPRTVEELDRSWRSWLDTQRRNARR